MKIFIVEDEIIVANDIERILVKNGFKVAGVATKYGKALEKINEIKPDLILCDIHLQGKRTGIHLMEELSRLIKFEIIFVSAYSDEGTIQDATNLNPFNYLTKPFNDKQLLTSVRMAQLSFESAMAYKKPSVRELEIIALISKGYNNEQIGEKLYISKHTVKTHRRNMLRRFKLKNTAELVTISMNQKWI